MRKNPDEIARFHEQPRISVGPFAERVAKRANLPLMHFPREKVPSRMQLRDGCSVHKNGAIKGRRKFRKILTPLPEASGTR